MSRTQSFLMGAVGALTLLVVVAGIAWAGNIFQIDRDGTVRMTVTDTGKVGVGTGSPVHKLHMYNSPGILLDAGTNTSSKQASLNVLTLGDGATNIGNATTKGWQLVGRGDGYVTASAQNDLHLSHWDGSGWTTSQRWDSTGNVGIGGDPGSSSMLEVISTSKGMTIPRMTKAQRDAIAAPAAGMLVYQTDNTPGLRVHNGANWMRFTEAAD
ncbi:MAG: hypothetical protein A2Z34_01670 [Planctomycetes bacterium RBG_16_59_8]|nr:MAG: hypothetical protein A2Z34_01670 [Planctomycetes bacterium RBG_16_59_8]